MSFSPSCCPRCLVPVRGDDDGTGQNEHIGAFEGNILADGSAGVLVVNLVGEVDKRFQIYKYSMKNVFHGEGELEICAKNDKKDELCKCQWRKMLLIAMSIGKISTRPKIIMSMAATFWKLKKPA